MDTPTHFFSDSVDLDASGLFGATPDCDMKEDGLDEQPLVLFPPSTPDPDLLASASSKPQDPKPGVWGGAMLDGDLFVEAKPAEQDVPKIKQEEPDRVEDAITVAPPTYPTPSTRRGSSSKSTASQRPSASRSASTDVTSPPAQGNSKKRKTEIVLKEEEADEHPGESTEKRQKFLERNRVAATKCRQKKKQWISDLEEKSAILESEKKALESQCHDLLEQIKFLKHLLMTHANCNEPSIDAWLKSEAQRFVTQQSDRFVQYPTPFPTSYGYAGPLDIVSHGSPVGNNVAYPGSEIDGPTAVDRRGSIAYSHTSTVQTTSPIDAGFPPDTGFPAVASPQFKIEEGDDMINLDHMPDSMFCSDQPLFMGV